MPAGADRNFVNRTPKARKPSRIKTVAPRYQSEIYNLIVEMTPRTLDLSPKQENNEMRPHKGAA